MARFLVAACYWRTRCHILDHHCRSIEMKNFNRRINHVSDNTFWHRRQGNFKRFLHSIRRKNESYWPKRPTSRFFLFQVVFPLIRWQQAAATERNTFDCLKYISPEVSYMNRILPVSKLISCVVFVDWPRVVQFGAWSCQISEEISRIRSRLH